MEFKRKNIFIGVSLAFILVVLAFILFGKLLFPVNNNLVNNKKVFNLSPISLTPIAFLLSEKDKPLIISVIEATQPVGGKLESGLGAAKIRFSCSAPPGYYILIMTAYVFENGETVSQGGFTMETSSDCPVSGSGGTIPSIGNGFVVTPSTPNIASIRYSLWINQGPIHETPTSPPDQVKEIILNWRGPGQ